MIIEYIIERCFYRSKIFFKKNILSNKLNMINVLKLISTIIISSIILTWYVSADASGISSTTQIELEKKAILEELKSDIYKWFKEKTLKHNNMILEDGVWYTYIYTKYQNFWKLITPSEKDLEQSWIDKESTLLLIDINNWAYFVKDYKKVKLISDRIITWISNKNEFLLQLVDDKRYLHIDTDRLFAELRVETIHLTKWLTDSEKIAKIYDYILNNTNYTAIFNINNKEVFSWIYTYQNNDWICGWYSKLNLYMLSFAWISNVEVIKWKVIDAENFKNIGHVWNKIWDKYYDLTFDDPTWYNKNKEGDEYMYFWLPENLFYADRFDYWTIPEEILSTTLEYRKSQIKTNLSKLTEKYKNNNYLLLRQFSFKKDNNISYTQNITTEDLKSMIPYYEVNDYKLTINDEIKKITNIKYYTVTNENINILLKQINYNLEWYTLLKWDNWNYRLASKISI